MVQKTVGDIGEDVKDTKLGFYWAEGDTAEERGRDGGECEEGGGVEKEEKKNYQRHLTCSSTHYFPQFLRLENTQHTKNSNNM